MDSNITEGMSELPKPRVERWRECFEKNTLNYFLITVVVLLAYFFAGKLGLSLAFVHPSATPVWPPTGIAIAAVLILGYKAWPALWFGAFLTNVTTAGGVLISAGIATGNTLEALAAVWLINRFSGGIKTFDNAWNIVKYAVLVGFIATPISASFGAGSLYFGNLAPRSEIGSIWSTWWLGDYMSALIMVPFIIVWVTKFNWPHKLSLRLLAEALGMSALFFLLTQVIFYEQFSIASRNYPLGYLFYPPMIWLTFRLGYLGAVTATVGITIVAVAYTLAGQGIFALASTNESLIHLQFFTGTTSVIFLILASVLYERELAQITLESAYSDLEKRVVERTIELANANVALTEADRQREILISVASHELKTPITAIKGYAQILKKRFERSGEALAVAHLSRMENQIDKLSRLIQDLMDVSRLRMNKFEFQREIIDIGSTVRETVEEMQKAANKHKITLEGQTDKLILGDKLRLGQVICNLISNAAKYSPDSDRIMVKILDGNVGKSITVCVQDFGMGIPKEHQENIFDLFYRINDQARETVDGFGIGLYIASEIVKAHDGRIWVESAVGEGSTFCFQLPTYE